MLDPRSSWEAQSRVERSSVFERLLLRIGLAGAGALFLHVAFILATEAPLGSYSADVAGMILCGLLGLGLCIGAAVRRPYESLRWLILAACLTEMFVRAALWTQTSYHPDLVISDPGLYTDVAGKLLQNAQNPYGWDYGGTFATYRTGREASTPRLDGSSERDYPYPALLIWLVIPWQVLGLPGTFTLGVLAQAIALTTLFRASPRSLQPLILLPIFVSLDFTPLTLIGAVDIVWATVLVLMIVSWGRPTLRAILYGCAAALKQTPWLILPFLLIRLWRDTEMERPLPRVVRFVAIAGLTFLAINGPFILWNPAAWLRSATEPLHDSLIYLSQGGLSTVTQLGYLYLPRNYYLVAVVAILGLLLWAYWRHYADLREALWVLPGAFMWFSYRTLISYWIFWLFPALASLVSRQPGPAVPRSSWKTTASIAVGVVIALAVGPVLAARPAAVIVRPIYPFVASGGRVDQITLELRNASGQLFTPRFAVQTLASVTNPLPWTIDSGPLTLAPGAQGLYQITANGERSFFFHEAAQIVVTDAGGDYNLRGVATLLPDRSYLWPDAVPNPAYRYWDHGQHVPAFWALTATPDGGGAAIYVSDSGRDGIKLTLGAATRGVTGVGLENLVLLPNEPLTLWIYPDPPAANSATVAYGLEIDDGQHRLWFLFGPQPYTGPVPAKTHVVYQFAPAATWTPESIDIPAAYSQFGLSLPDSQPVDYRGIDANFRVVRLSLFLTTAGPHDLLEARFGPIEQPPYHLDSRALMVETISSPAAYYIKLGNQYERARNYAAAANAFRDALRFAPDDPEALAGIEAMHKKLAQDRSP